MPDEERDPTICPCGQGAHYSSEKARETCRILCEQFGPTITVQVSDADPPLRVAVPRAYVFLHGFRAADAADLAARYGWETLDG
jgi:hypothetical protein